MRRLCSFKLGLDGIIQRFLFLSLIFAGVTANAVPNPFKVVMLKQGQIGISTETDTIYGFKSKISRNTVDGLMRDHGIPTVAGLPEQLDWVHTTSWHKTSAAVKFNCDQLLSSAGMNSLYDRTVFTPANDIEGGWRHFRALSNPPVGGKVTLEYQVGCGTDAPSLLKSAFRHQGEELGYFAHINYNYSDYYDVFILFVSAYQENGYIRIETSAAYAYKDSVWAITKSAIEGQASGAISSLIRRLIALVPSKETALAKWVTKND